MHTLTAGFPKSRSKLCCGLLDKELAAFVESELCTVVVEREGLEGTREPGLGVERPELKEESVQGSFSCS